MWAQRGRDLVKAQRIGVAMAHGEAAGEWVGMFGGKRGVVAAECVHMGRVVCAGYCGVQACDIAG